MPWIAFLPDFGAWFTLFVLIALLALWIAQFVALMSLTDDRFSGQYVRFGWIVAFLVLWGLAPIAFLLWNHGRAGRSSSVSHLHRGQREEAE